VCTASVGGGEVLVWVAKYILCIQMYVHTMHIQGYYFCGHPTIGYDLEVVRESIAPTDVLPGATSKSVMRCVHCKLEPYKGCRFHRAMVIG